MPVRLIVHFAMIVLISTATSSSAFADDGAGSTLKTADWRSVACCPDPAAAEPPIDGTGSGARFGAFLEGIVYDEADGFIYVADQDGDVIRRLSPDGKVSTYAGNCDRNTTSGACQGGHVDGNRLTARFDQPEGVGYDPTDRSLYVTEMGNMDVRRISPDGVVSTLASADFLGVPLSITYDGSNSAMLVTSGRGAFEATGNVLSRKGSMRSVYGTAYDSITHRLDFDDLSSVGILAADGSKRTLAGSCVQDSSGGIWTECWAGTIDGVGSKAVFNHIQGLTFDAKSGELYVADWNAVRGVSSDGVVTTIAGSCRGKSDADTRDCPEGNADGFGAAASFGIVRGISYDASVDALFVVDQPNREVRRVDLDGTVTTITGSPATSVDQSAEWAATYDWGDAGERLVTQVRDGQELELFYKDGRLFEVRSGRRNTDYQADFELFYVQSRSIVHGSLTYTSSGFERTGDYDGPVMRQDDVLAQVGCSTFGPFTPSDGRITGGDKIFGKWSLESAASTNCRALRVVDADGNVDFQDFERTDIPHKEQPQWVRLH